MGGPNCNPDARQEAGVWTRVSSGASGGNAFDWIQDTICGDESDPMMQYANICDEPEPTSPGPTSTPKSPEPTSPGPTSTPKSPEPTFPGPTAAPKSRSSKKSKSSKRSVK